MSSLALYAAPFDNNENSSDNDKKRMARNKTIKKRVPSTGNIESLISKIHQNADNDTDDSTNSNGDNSNNLIGDDYMSAGMKLPMPVSIGAQRKTNGEISNKHIEIDMENTNSSSPQHNNNNNNNSNGAAKGNKRTEPIGMGLDGFNTMNERSNPENYDNTAPTYTTPYYINQQTTPNRDVLIEKLNYMIHLLEEQRDEKVGSITEEVILYSFLGIFIIFIVDSFARAGKYVR
jgi:hypothetical protein